MDVHETTDQLKNAFDADAYKDFIGPNNHLLDQQTYQLRLPAQREVAGHAGRFAQSLGNKFMIERWMFCE